MSYPLVAMSVDAGDQVLAAVVGVLSSVVASIIWLLMLRRMRPRIDVSTVIAQDPAEPDSPPCYRIKIANRSKRAAVDFAFELAVMRPARTRGGIVQMRKVVRIAGPPPLMLPGRRKDGGDHNTYRLRVDADLRGILEQDENRFVRLRIFARDEVSGIGSVTEREYHDPDAEVLIGKYAKGQNFDIV